MEQLKSGLWNGHPASPVPRRAAWSAVQTLRKLVLIPARIQYASAPLEARSPSVQPLLTPSSIQYASRPAGSLPRATASPPIRARRLDLPTVRPRSVDFSRLPAAAAGRTSPLRRLALAPLRAGRQAMPGTGVLRSRQGRRLRSRQGRRRVASRYRAHEEGPRHGTSSCTAVS